MPIAAAGQPEPKRAGQDAPLHDLPGIVQGDHGIGLRIDHQLGVVRGTVEHPPGAGSIDGGRDLGGEAGGLVVAEGVAFEVPRAQPHRKRAGEGGLAAAGAADHNDPLGDRFGGRRTGCHMGKVGRRWWCRQDPAGRSGVLGEPGAKTGGRALRDP